MCGIAGVALEQAAQSSGDLLRRMIQALHHRGPDGSGIWTSDRVGLAHTRLSVIDPASGAQPMANEDGTIRITFNGEVYNYRELRLELLELGHIFRTHSDTETLIHAYESWGDDLVHRLVGQFAFAIYDGRRDRLLLVRDRFGVRPLLYAEVRGSLLFASDARALFATGEVAAEPDLIGLDEVFTFWGVRAPRTPFKGVRQLAPGTLAVWEFGRLTVTPYYNLDFREERNESPDAIGQLDSLLRDSVALRMRADVPVGGYLSGGLDSSIIAALATSGSVQRFHTFSLTFDDPALDERVFQEIVADALRTPHATTRISGRDIAEVFPDVVLHAGTPMLRTAPAPMYQLARLVRERGMKVVLTGEGADELFLGYDIFKELSVRLFCRRQPDSPVRPRLFDRLYPYVDHARGGGLWQRALLEGGHPGDPLFSHLPRFALASRIKPFYSADTKAALAKVDVVGELRGALPERFMDWSPLNRAAYLEMTTLLPSYLLGTQGDRMAMAHGVETRFPFLDHRLFEMAAALPTSSKLLGLREKEILRRWARGLVPLPVLNRSKQPYRAPDTVAFFEGGEPEYVDALMGDAGIRASGLFDPVSVAALLRRARAGRVSSVAENQCFVGILSTQLWHRSYFATSSSLGDSSHGRQRLLVT